MGYRVDNMRVNLFHVLFKKSLGQRRNHRLKHIKKMSFLDKIFGGSLIKDIGKALDNLFTSKEEKIKATTALKNVIQKHRAEMEAMYLQDRASARKRETESKDNLLMKALGFTVMFIFVLCYGCVFFMEIPESKDHIITHLIGLVEGVILSMVGYYFGTSKSQENAK